MATIVQAARDKLHYASGYLSGASPRTFSDIPAFVLSRVTGLLTLPLPLLSFLALPFFGGTSTTLSVAFFWLTWTALVLSHDPLQIELMGTLVIRSLCFALPALAFLAFDLLLPRLSTIVKARQQKSLPQYQLDRNDLFKVTAVASGNVLIGVAVQGVLELLTTRVFHLRSILKVSTTVPLPWSIFKDILSGLVLRGVLHYGVHRYLLHGYQTPLRTWHLKWQHSINRPFSVVAAYDHPAAYLVGHWLPSFLPAYLFRFHVLTWHLFIAIVSLEDLFVYSGYAVLPSSIVLAGMARRTDAHFEAAQSRRAANGNYGYLGVMDLIFRTTLTSTTDVVDDVKDEAQKHSLDDRIEDAVAKAMAKINDAPDGGKKDEKAQRAAVLKNAGNEKEKSREVDDSAEQPSSRVTRWRKARKG
nr:hypothetical protein CFP56_68355 [Quercus suber]